MADAFVHKNATLEPLLLSNVLFSGTIIGTGAYSRVELVTVPVEAAAKKYTTQDRTSLLRECELLNGLCHPHVVHFIGLFSDQEPALVMERMLTSLHDLLDPETQPPPGAPRPLSFFTMDLKCSVLHNVASGLAYLHGQSLIHRNLTAKNLLLDTKIIAKITDLGVARFSKADGSRKTVASETIYYMPPEVLEDSFKYESSIDIFSFGIVTMFAIGEVFPSNPQQPTYYDESRKLVARNELQRRNVFMKKVRTKLQVKDHPFVSLIEKCLENLPTKRPSIDEVLDVLEKASDSARVGDDIEREKHQLVQALLKQQKQPRNQNFERVRHDIVTENADLFSRLQKIEEKEKRTQQKLKHLEQIQQELESCKELQRKEAEENMRLRQELELYKGKEAENRASSTLKCDRMQSGSVSSSQAYSDTDGAKKSISVEDFKKFPKPELFHLLEFIGVKVKAEWRKLGLGLGLQQSELDSIAVSRKGEADPAFECMTQVFSKWYTANTKEYSWKELAVVMCSSIVNKRGLLQDMHEKLSNEYKNSV